MKKTAVIITLVFLLLASGLYFGVQPLWGKWDKLGFSKVLKSHEEAKVTNTTKVSNSKPEVSVEGCEQFTKRFGKDANRLITDLNKIPETASITRGFRYINGEIISADLNGNLPLSIEINCRGEIVSFKCQRNSTITNSTQDFRFTIPEADFGSLISRWSSLTNDDAILYLQNFSTNPSEVRQTIIQRIINLN